MKHKVEELNLRLKLIDLGVKTIYQEIDIYKDSIKELEPLVKFLERTRTKKNEEIVQKFLEDSLRAKKFEVCQFNTKIQNLEATLESENNRRLAIVKRINNIE